MLRRMTRVALAALAIAACNEVTAPVSRDNALGGSGLQLAPASSVAGPACAPVPAGLVSWWRGEGNGNDFTGTNPALLQGTTAYAGGEVGQGFKFDGAGFILVPDDPSLNLSEQITAEFWFNYTYWPDFLSMLGKRRADGITNYGVNMNPASLGLGVYYNDPNALGGDDYDWAHSPYEALRLFPVPTAGVFHHFAGTYRQLESGIELLMYVDGQLVRADTLPGSLANTITDADLALGASTAAGVAPFRGVLDEIALYNRALSAAEIESIHQAGPAGKCVTTPFAGLYIDRADLKMDRGASVDRLDLWGRLELASSSDGMAPFTEDVELTFGGMSQVIPAGSFVRTDGDDGFQYSGTAPGIMRFVILDNGLFRLRWGGPGLDWMATAASPVGFGLRIGNDAGEASVLFDDVAPSGFMRP